MVCHSDGVPGVVAPSRPRLADSRPAAAPRRRQLHLVRDVTGHHEPEPLAGLRGDVDRVGELDLLRLEFGDLRAQGRLAGGELLHLGALREVGAHRAGDGQRQHAHHRGQDGGPPRGRTQPLLAAAVPPTPRWPGGSVSVSAVCDRLGRCGTGGPGSRWPPATLRERARPDAPGRDAGARRFGSGRLASATVIHCFASTRAPHEPRERQIAGVAGGVAERLLDAQQLVVLGHPLAAGRRTGLDLAAADGARPGRRSWCPRSRRCGGSSSCGSRCCAPARPRPASRSACRSG